MIYYGNNATLKRIEWWESLSEREQNLRICLFEIQKIAIPEQKTLLRYKKSRKEVLNAKAILKQLKLVAKAIKRQIPGYINIEKADDYSADWYCRRNCKEILLPYLEKYFDKVASLLPGDLVSYRWGYSSYAHLSIYLGNRKFAHCDADDGCCITGADEPKFWDALGRSRITGYWRLKDGLFQRT